MAESIIGETASVHGVRIRLTFKQFWHITMKRPYLYRHPEKIFETIKNPDTVLKGWTDELLAVKYYRDLLGGKYLVVVYRQVGREGFVVTAFPTSKKEWLERREIIWRKKKPSK